jgi:class 3 adenylate cyclase
MVICVNDGLPPADLEPVGAPSAPPAAEAPREGVLRSLRLRVRREGIEEGELGGPGLAATAPPVPHTEPEPLAVVRSFGFVDISGFTAFCDRHGELQAFELLATFRTATREVAARRGVRVAKWLGDGVMLVGLDPTALAATVAEITAW